MRPRHKRVILDLSTTSLAFNAGIIEITAIAFSPEKEDVFHEYVSVANVRKLGLGVSQSTLDYYQKNQIGVLLEQKGKTKTRLASLLTFLNSSCVPTVEIWCDIAFDYPILGNNFLAAGYKTMPLRHNSFQDYPTLSQYNKWAYTPKNGVNGSYEQCMERIKNLRMLDSPPWD